MTSGTLCMAQQPSQPVAGQRPEDALPTRVAATDPSGAIVQTGKWSLALSLFQAYDGKGYADDVFAGTGGTLVTLYGLSTGGSVRGSFVAGGVKGGFSADAGASLQQYYNNGGNSVQETTALASEWRKLGRNTTIFAAQSLTRAPYFTAGAFPGVGTYAGTDILRPYLGGSGSGLDSREINRFNNEVKANHIINQHTTLAVTYRVATNGMTGTNAGALMQDIGGRINRDVTRALGYHVGYSFGNAQFGGLSPTTLHNIDVGLDLKKRLSLTRRTEVTFTTGTAFIKVKPIESAATTGPLKQFTVLGNARLNHYFGQTWVAALTYDRGWQIYDGLMAPYLGNGLTAALTGKWGQFLTAGASTGFETGVPIGTSTGRNRATVANAWLQYAMSARIRIYGQYGFYAQRFSFPSDVTSISLPGRLSRNSARVGLTLTLPQRSQAQKILAPKQPVR